MSDLASGFIERKESQRLGLVLGNLQSLGWRKEEGTYSETDGNRGTNNAYSRVSLMETKNLLVEKIEYIFMGSPEIPSGAPIFGPP